MKLEEAIKDLTNFQDFCERVNWRTHANAIKLGIEALKWFIEARKGPVASVYNLLPGETEDQERR